MEDLGRDMASVQGLQRKHEGHERELLVVQQQVETLNAESAKLQAAYQGSTLLVFLKERILIGTKTFMLWNQTIKSYRSSVTMDVGPPEACNKGTKTSQEHSEVTKRGIQFKTQEWHAIMVLKEALRGELR